ncbi:MAG TPA: hypothetical protein VKA49_12600 [Flavitalea sp.]|nr:hypothetical protein [Flavitalea sp.]
MLVRRYTFFLTLFILLISPFLVRNLVWLAGSVKTTGTVSFIGRAFAGQGMDFYSVVWFVAGKDTVWFNGKNSLLFTEGKQVPVRYQRTSPSDARLDIFLAIWGDTVIYGGLLEVVLLVVFFHPQIIPYQSKIRLLSRRPFIQIV